MKIESQPPILRVNKTADPSSPTGGPGRAESRSGSTGPADQVRLSAAGREFFQIREAALKAPEIRTALVSELRERIAGGAYEPDARAIAKRMLEELGAGLGE